MAPIIRCRHRALIRRRIVRRRRLPAAGAASARAPSCRGTRGPAHGRGARAGCAHGTGPRRACGTALRDVLRPDRKTIQPVHRSGLPVSQHGARSNRAGAAHLNRHAPGRRGHHRTVRHRQDLAVPRRHRAARSADAHLLSRGSVSDRRRSAADAADRFRRALARRSRGRPAAVDRSAARHPALVSGFAGIPARRARSFSSTTRKTCRCRCSTNCARSPRSREGRRLLHVVLLGEPGSGVHVEAGGAAAVECPGRGAKCARPAAVGRSRRLRDAPPGCRG